MLFSNTIKGQVSQTLIKTLLERAGYRVTRFGIEELFQEVIYMDAEQYAKLGLPKISDCYRICWLRMRIFRTLFWLKSNFANN